VSPIYCVLEILKSLEKAKEEAIPSSGKDWEPVFEAARRQGLSAPLYHRLKETGGLEKMPADLRKKAHSDYLRNAARNMRVYHELGKILRRCDEAGLPVIVLKGAHLAQTVYENIALRTFGDLDLLVRETDLGKIDGLLSRERYVRTEASLEATPAAHHFLYRHKTVGLTIELHWRLFDSQFPANIGTEELFSRADEVVIAGQPAYVMESIDEVLYLCVHAAKHTSQPLTGPLRHRSGHRHPQRIHRLARARRKSARVAGDPERLSHLEALPGLFRDGNPGRDDGPARSGGFRR